MKFYDPRDEAALLGALRQRREGRAFDRDSWTAEGWFGYFCRFVLGCLAVAMLVWRRDDWPVGPGWQMLMVGILFTFQAVLLHGACAVERHPGWGSLLLLPVPGTTIARWVRGRVLMGSWQILVRAGLAVWFLHAAWLDHMDYPVLAGHAVALWLVTIATAALYGDPTVQRWRISQLWSTASTGFLVIALVALFAREAKASWLHAERWMEDAAPWIAAVFPPAWLGSTALTWAWALVLLMFLVAGLRCWLEWPRVLGAALDQPQDMFGGADASDDEEEGVPTDASARDKEHTGDSDSSGGANSSIPNKSAVAALEVARVSVPEVFAAQTSGWIERFVLRLLGARSRDIAPVLLPDNPRWSHRWRLALKLGTAGIIAVAIARFCLPPNISDTIILWICLAQAAVLAVLVLPFSNGLEYVTQPFPVGAQVIAAHILLPVTARDLLRLSWQVTCARTFTALPLVALGCAGNALVLDGTLPGVLAAVKVGCGLVILMAMQRPLLIAWRINERTRSVWWHRLILVITLLVVGSMSLLVAAAGLITLGASVTSQHGWLLFLIALGIFLAQGGLNYGIFVLYRAHLRRGRIDFLTAP